MRGIAGYCLGFFLVKQYPICTKHVQVCISRVSKYLQIKSRCYSRFSPKGSQNCVDSADTSAISIKLFSFMQISQTLFLEINLTLFLDALARVLELKTKRNCFLYLSQLNLTLC